MNELKRNKAHLRLLETIDREARETASLTGRKRFSDLVMTAMSKVPRHQFVLPEDVDYAYINRPRGIGHGQTISQPYIVALMTDLLDLSGNEKVLEIGTGSGYQTAVLAEAAGHVYSVETIEELAIGADRRLRRLGYDNIDIISADGFKGWRDNMPYDAIMVTAAPESIPEALIEQLGPGGRMAIPVGGKDQTQILCRGYKDTQAGFKISRLLPVVFVPMVAAKGIAIDHHGV